VKSGPYGTNFSRQRAAFTPEPTRALIDLPARLPATSTESERAGRSPGSENPSRTTAFSARPLSRRGPRRFEGRGPSLRPAGSRYRRGAVVGSASLIQGDCRAEDRRDRRLSHHPPETPPVQLRHVGRRRRDEDSPRRRDRGALGRTFRRSRLRGARVPTAEFSAKCHTWPRRAEARSSPKRFARGRDRTSESPRATSPRR